MGMERSSAALIAEFMTQPERAAYLLVMAVAGLFFWKTESLIFVFRCLFA